MAEEPKPEQKTPAPDASAGDAGKPVAPKPPAAAAKPAAPKAPAVMASTPWEGELPSLLREQFGDQILEAASYLGQNFMVVKPDAAIPVIEFLRLECDFDYMVDITATHWPDKPEEFEVIYILYSFARNERVRIKIRIAEDYKPESTVSVYIGADWMEREVYDMFGIEFANHPNMKRLLMPDDWEGHPLRKDYRIIQMDNRWVEQNLGIESGQ